MSENENTESKTGDLAKQLKERRGAASGLMSSPGAKFILIGFISLVLLIPTLMVWGLVEERSRMARDVAKEIAQGWGASQLINGPYLVVPYEINKGTEEKPERITRHAILSPEFLNIDGEIDVTERQKSIYKTQLYHLNTQLEGNFSALDLRHIHARGGKPKLSEAFLVLGVSDVTGFRSDIEIAIDGASDVKFLPGLNHIENSGNRFNKGNRRSGGGGVHLPLNHRHLISGFDFKLSMALNGSENLSFLPAGKATKLNIKSNWPHPGFEGRFLPEKREIAEDGFTASWTVPELARGMNAVQMSSTLPISETLMKVNFVEPLKFYQITARTLKYSIAFIALTFLAIFILEISNQRRVHWIQYMLVGFALVVFYILLLALAEQFGFGIAYFLSAAATTILITWYVGDALATRSGSYITGTVLTMTYLIMYLILNEEQYALLAGSLIAFAAIAATMIATRKVNWSGSENTEPDALEALK